MRERRADPEEARARARAPGQRVEFQGRAAARARTAPGPAGRASARQVRVSVLLRGGGVGFLSYLTATGPPQSKKTAHGVQQEM